MKVLLFLFLLFLSAYCIGMASMLASGRSKKCASCKYLRRCWRIVDDVAKSRSACENYEERDV